MIVVIEGIDASGKHTQANFLAETLKRLGPTSLLSFPQYETTTGSIIKQILTNELSLPAERSYRATILQSLFLADRYSVLSVLREHHQDKARHLVLDRYYTSGLVYGQSEGLSLPYLRAIHSGLPPADLWFLLDVPVESSTLRRPERRDANERDQAKLSVCAALYRDLFRSKTLGGTCIILDGSKSIEEIQERIEEETLKLHKSMSKLTPAELARSALADEVRRKAVSSDPKHELAGSKVWKSREPRLAEHVLRYAGTPLPSEVQSSNRELALISSHRGQVDALERTISDLHAELREARFQRDRSKFAYEAAYELAEKIALECADPERIDSAIKRSLKDLNPNTERSVS